MSGFNNRRQSGKVAMMLLSALFSGNNSQAKETKSFNNKNLTVQSSGVSINKNSGAKSPQSLGRAQGTIPITQRKFFKPLVITASALVLATVTGFTIWGLTRNKKKDEKPIKDDENKKVNGESKDTSYLSGDGLKSFEEDNNKSNNENENDSSRRVISKKESKSESEKDNNESDENDNDNNNKKIIQISEEEDIKDKNITEEIKIEEKNNQNKIDDDDDDDNEDEIQEYNNQIIEEKDEDYIKTKTEEIKIEEENN